MEALVVALAAFAFVGILLARRLDRRDREAEIRQWRYAPTFPRRPGCRCRLCLVADVEYKASL